MSSEKVALELVKHIESGAVSVGQYLPTTRELAAQYGVTLHAVCTALRQLEEMSLVERRPRHGTIVLAQREKTQRTVPSNQVKQVAMLVNGSDLNWAGEPSPSGQWSHRIVHAFEKQMFDAGYSVSLMPHNQNIKDGPTLLQRLERLGDTLHGAMALSPSGMVETIHLFKKHDIPLVTINRPAHGTEHNYIAADNIEAGWRVGRIFHASNISRVLLVSNVTPYALSSGEKMAGFMQSCFELGLPLDRIRMVYVDSNFARNKVCEAVLKVLDEGFIPQGVFTAGDIIAAGVIDALTSRGLSVPGDVGIISTTGVDSTGPGDIALSWVSQPMEALGESAAQMLLEMMREGTRRYVGRRIPCPIIMRDSFRLSDEARANLAREPDMLWSSQIRE